MKNIFSRVTMFIIPLLLLASMVFLLYLFEKRETNQLIEHYYDHMTSSASEHEKALSATLDTPFTVMESFAAGPLFTDPVTLNAQSIAKRMHELSSTSPVEEYFFLSTDKKMLSEDGTWSEYKADNFDSIITADDRLVLKTSEHSEFMHDSFILTVPVYKADKQLGSLVGTYSTDNFADIMQSHRLGGHTIGVHYVIALDGRVLLANASVGETYVKDNLFAYSDGADIEGYTSDSFKTALINGESISSTFSKDGGFYFIYATPLYFSSFNTDGWYIIEATSQKTLKADLGTSRELIVLAMIITCIATAIIELLLLKQLKDSEKNLRRARLDMMTGILNRNTLISTIQRSIERSTGSSCAFMIVDIDNLKHINDSFGHTAGDEAITAMAAALKAGFRETDIIGRIGGDEFAVFINDISSMDNIEPILIRLLKSISSTSIADGKAMLSGSVGVAVGIAGINSIDELYRRADEALYQVKNSGKSSYCFYKCEDSVSQKTQEQV